MPYSPGGGTDFIARTITQRLERRLGQPIVFEYRPGAGSAIAAAYVSRQPADGYTILYATSTTMAINVSVHKRLAYDPVKDFVPIALFAVTPFVLVVNAEPADPLGGRSRGLCEVEARRAELRLERAGRRGASVRRADQDHARHRDDARAVQGQRAGAQRRGRRAMSR